MQVLSLAYVILISICNSFDSTFHGNLNKVTPNVVLKLTDIKLFLCIFAFYVYDL